MNLKRLLSITGSFVKELYSKKALIFSLAIRDFKSMYLGSTLGVTWVFVEPFVYIAVMWFFFTKALNFQPSGGKPYVSWLMPSLIMWNYFNSALSSSAGTFKSYSYLLKKPEFNMSILPVVSILSSLFVHFIFAGILIILFFVTQIKVTVFWLQSIYYLFALSTLLLGISWITASISLFIKDVRYVVSVVLQIGFWMSPIFWDLNTYPERLRFLLKINPLTYALEGYRKSFLYGEPFWNDVTGLIYFWIFTIAALGIGMVTYRRLRPHFGDVI